jgi:ADP-heptose:LPS heptosyltransferase
MRTIVISPYSRPLRNGKPNAKNWPRKYWDELVGYLRHRNDCVIQIGVSKETPVLHVNKISYNLPFPDLEKLIKESWVWISVDNFLPHFCHLKKLKPGIVIFGPSDPEIFGYPENINLLKGRQYLREKQFDIWEACEANDEAFVFPSDVMERAILPLTNK